MRNDYMFIIGISSYGDGELGCSLRRRGWRHFLNPIYQGSRIFLLHLYRRGGHELHPCVKGILWIYVPKWMHVQGSHTSSDLIFNCVDTEGIFITLKLEDIMQKSFVLWANLKHGKGVGTQVNPSWELREDKLSSSRVETSFNGLLY